MQSQIGDPHPPRFRIIRKLQTSLFGEVQLAYDEHLLRTVAVKVSLRNPVGSTAAMWTQNTGEIVPEDVRREARVLRWVHSSKALVDPRTAGLSDACLHRMTRPANLQRVAEGRTRSVKLFEDIESSEAHLLIVEYVGGGEMLKTIQDRGEHSAPLDESIARAWFHDLCTGVQFLHAISVAHMDLSLENSCLDAKNGMAKLIDFGLASRHPQHIAVASDGSNDLTAPHMRLLTTTTTTTNKCTCSTCRVTDAELLQRDRAVRRCLVAGVPLTTLKFLCRPSCLKLAKSGKRGYMSPEMSAGQVFDAYKCDIFALGVILYSLLAMCPPFTVPNNSDLWFRLIYSGRWLHPDVRSQPCAATYNHMSEHALQLIDSMLKPQHLRPTIDQVLRSPFFKGPRVHVQPLVTTTTQQQSLKRRSTI